MSVHYFVLILNAVYVERWHDILMNKIYAEELTLCDVLFNFLYLFRPCTIFFLLHRCMTIILINSIIYLNEKYNKLRRDVLMDSIASSWI